MLDDCKGERLEEILATFSNAVLKKVLLNTSKATTSAIAQQLAFENLSYSGERTALSTLILAHKASLHSHLRGKGDANARYHDFAELLNLNDRRITRRHEQLKQATQDRGPQDTLSVRDIHALQDQVANNWSGREEWLDAILYGDTKIRREGLLAAKFDSVWKHVEDGSIGDIEEKKHIGLLEQLDARVRNQETRLARWQDFGKTLLKSGTTSPTRTTDPGVPQEKRIDLGFNLHQSLQISHNKASETVEATAHESLKEYSQLIEDMKAKLADVGKASTQEQQADEKIFPEECAPISPMLEKDETPSQDDDEWSSVSEIDEAQPSGNYSNKPSISPDIGRSSVHLRTRSNPPLTGIEDQKSDVLRSNIDPQEAPLKSHGRPTSPKYPRSQTPPPVAVPKTNQSLDSESDLADQILNSVSASSPSPKKSRHTLSLAERTRLSMSRASHSQYSDLHDDVDSLAELPRLPTKPRSQPVVPSSSGEDKHAGLIERTRKSMAGFEAAQKKAQLERRRSVKDAKKRQRESSYFPTLNEEPSPVGINPVELIEGDPDYESVFKSRPKIKTSPAVSPTRAGYEY